MKNILLEGKEHTFTAGDLPILISGAHGTGSSYLAILLIAQLFAQGEKIVFFTAHPMAKEKLLEVVGTHKGIGVVNSEDDIDLQRDEQLIIIKSGAIDLFHKVIESLDDIDERIVFLKNIDEFGAAAYLPVSAHEKIIFQGDIDKSSFGEAILEKGVESKLYFSQPKSDASLKVQQLDLFQAQLFSPNSKGVISTIM